ncbi:hypothetical protein [Rhizobium sp. AQ_MP]|nr:hypothetical protein [Rhizobium sp. AQ_MP]
MRLEPMEHLADTSRVCGAGLGANNSAQASAMAVKTRAVSGT